MLAAATSLFSKPTSLSAYNLHSTAPSPASSSTNLPSTASSSAGPSTPRTLTVGLWSVLGATHKTTGKDVSVWIFEKRLLVNAKGNGADRNDADARAFVLEQLKKEVSLMSQ